MSSDDYIDFDPHDNHRFGEIKLMVTPHAGLHCFRFAWAPEPDALPNAFMREAALAGVKRNDCCVNGRPGRALARAAGEGLKN